MLSAVPSPDDLFALLDEIVDDMPPGYVYRNEDGVAAGTDDPNSPDELYPNKVSCHYVHFNADGEVQPGCIVAHVLDRWGVSLYELRAHENKIASSVVEELLPPLLPNVRLSPRDAWGTPELRVVKEILNDVQCTQDTGVPWSSAVSSSRRKYREIEGMK